MLKDYYSLTKPGIIRGNIINTAGGGLLASTGRIDFWLLIATLTGTSLIIACAGVFNNYVDRGIDAKMNRTKQRALVSGTIPALNALIYGTVLGILGFLVMAVYTNALTIAIGAAALFMYVAVYGYFKRRTPFGTLVGSIPGALPPVAGYVAVTGRLDAAAYVIFAILVCWQMAHFYAIAMYRFKDYRAAGLPVLPVVRGMSRAKLSIIGYIMAFMVACALLTIFDYTGIIYLVIMLSWGLAWLLLGLRNFKTADDEQWGRQMFLFSLTVILALAVMLSIGARLP